MQEQIGRGECSEMCSCFASTCELLKNNKGKAKAEK
jgi:hypothetical protein